MKTNALLLAAGLAIFFLQPILAQHAAEPRTENVLKINLPRGIFSYEFSTGKQQTIHLQAGSRFFLFIDETADEQIDIDLFVDPALRAQYRFYYNLKKRAAQEKRTDLNSGEYLTPSAEVWYSRMPVRGNIIRDERRWIYTTGFAWGFQRNLASRFSIEYQIGPGVVFAQGQDLNVNGLLVPAVRPTIIGGLSLGFWLNSSQELARRKRE